MPRGIGYGKKAAKKPMKKGGGSKKKGSTRKPKSKRMRGASARGQQPYPKLPY